MFKKRENNISEIFSLALLLDYIIIIHRDSQGIIFIKSSYNTNLDPKYIESFRRAIKQNIINLPKFEGEIEYATLEGKFVLTRTGKKVWTSIIINQKPTLFARDALNEFSIEFETHFEGRISKLYTKFQGDISIFQQESITRKTIDEIIENNFHLSLALPHRIDPSKGKDMTDISKKIFNIAKNLARKPKRIINLEELLIKTKKKLTYETEEILNSIYDLIEDKLLVPFNPEIIEEH